MSTTRVEISQKTIIFTVGLLLSLWVLYQVRSIVILLFISFILMTAVNPLVKLARRHKIPILPLMLFIYIAVLTTLSVVLASLVPAVIDQSKALSQNLPQIISNLESSFNIKIDPNMGSSYLANIPSNILRFAVGAFTNIINLLAVFFITYYMTIERRYMHLYLAKLFPNKNKEQKAEDMVNAVEERVGGWVRGELFLMLVIGVMTYFGLLILQIPYALPLAVLAGMLELVPNLGPVIAAIPAILLGLSISPVTGLGVTIMSVLVQQLENNLIVPKIMQSATGTKPLATIVTLLVGYTLGGVVGAILSMPIFLSLQTVYAHLSEKEE